MDEIELENNPAKHCREIGMAVAFVRTRVNKFEKLPEIIVPNFPITEKEIEYLERCARKTLLENHEAAGVKKDEWYYSYLEETARLDLNMMLQDKNDPLMKYYLNDYKLQTEGAE